MEKKEKKKKMYFSAYHLIWRKGEKMGSVIFYLLGYWDVKHHPVKSNLHYPTVGPYLYQHLLEGDLLDTCKKGKSVSTC